MEDISSDYARKTATVDPFPHAAISAVGIHPCMHAQTMQRLCETSIEGGGKPLLVDQCVLPSCDSCERPRTNIASLHCAVVCYSIDDEFSSSFLDPLHLQLLIDTILLRVSISILGQIVFVLHFISLIRCQLVLLGTRC